MSGPLWVVNLIVKALGDSQYLIRHASPPDPTLTLRSACVRCPSVSRPVTASAADAPPTRSGVEDPARIASSEVRREPARAIYGPSVVVRGSG